METIYNIKIANIITKNIYNTFNLVINNHPCTKIPTKSIKISLIDSTNNQSEYLNLKSYSIYANGNKIYENILDSNKNIFPCENIPLGEIKHHNILIVILNLDLNFMSTYINYYLQIIHTEYVETGNNYNNLNGNNNLNYSIPWNYLVPKNDINTMVITSGMLGLANNNIYDDIEYVIKNNTIHGYNINSKLELLNIQHLNKLHQYNNEYQYNCDEYSATKNLFILCNYYRDCCLVSDTLKIPYYNFELMSNIDNKYLYKSSVILSYGLCDSLTNISFLCDNIEIKMIKSTITIERNFNKIIEHSLEFSENYHGYYILGINNFNHIPIVGTNDVTLTIEFEINNKIDNYLFDKLWVKFDRVVYDSPIRRHIAQNDIDYDEYPIVDINEYYIKKNI